MDSYLSQTDAQTQGLIGLTSSGNTIIKVDNTTVGPEGSNYTRATVSMSSQNKFTQGSLVLFQATHMPYGCGVWPGFWTLGGDASNWPLYGEMDIVEQVNLATNNQYSLHTEQGCTRPAPATGLQTGTAGQADCWNMTNYNTGCITVETKPNNYGAGFANNGGGAYALQWTDDAIRFWFFPRASIPADFDSANPQPGNWGAPGGLYPQATCDFPSHFGPQAIKLDIDLCGLYAGLPNIFNANGLCSGKCVDLINNPSNWNTAYYEIEFLRVFTEYNGTAPPATSTSVASHSSNPTFSATTGAPTTSGKTGAAALRALISAPLLYLGSVAGAFVLFS
ncbi:hypothetical protein DL93DRAFT_2082589 [Clavulina sp. PMI_390]|nr:hypothetical protein DL93DRAFT_2082589 [Clavulina sp. PMI_390]